MAISSRSRSSFGVGRSGGFLLQSIMKVFGDVESVVLMSSDCHLSQ